MARDSPCLGVFVVREPALDRRSDAAAELVVELEGEGLFGLDHDAQTSGGLLIAVPPDRADTLVEALKKRQTRSAVVIGHVQPRSEHTIVVR